MKIDGVSDDEQLRNIEKVLKDIPAGKCRIEIELERDGKLLRVPSPHIVDFSVLDQKLDDLGAIKATLSPLN